MSVGGGQERALQGVCCRCSASASIALVSCPRCGGAIAPAPAVRRGLLDLPPMLYPGCYAWFVFISALDLMLTGIILLLLDGCEVNPLADAVIVHAGWRGLVAFKFCLVLFVVVMCEWTGRRNPRAGTKLSEWSVMITAVPVALSLIQLVTCD